MAVVGALQDTSAAIDLPYTPRSVPTRADRVFRLVTTAAGMISLLVVVVTLIFLVDKSRPAYQHSGVVGFFTHSTWSSTTSKFGVLGLAENTLLISLVGLCVGVPVAVAMAVFINEYAPWRVRQIITSAIDLLAAMPSLLFGIWGLVALEGPIVHLASWFNRHLSVLPFFRLSPSQTSSSGFTGSTFQAGLVVGVMIIPIVTSVSRDVMSQVPREQCEGALALGGTRWGMVRDVILPFARNGIVGGILLGLGRALGETIAIEFIVDQVVALNPHILARGSGSIASWIANNFYGSTPTNRAGLVGAGLTLFFLTLIVNVAARFIVSRTSKFS
jgi:phosphate transport system permease protein